LILRQQHATTSANEAQNSKVALLRQGRLLGHPFSEKYRGLLKIFIVYDPVHESPRQCCFGVNWIPRKQQLSRSRQAHSLHYASHACVGINETDPSRRQAEGRTPCCNAKITSEGKLKTTP
jgi:hypothetical protein